MERARLYLLLAWFHAIVQERLVYSPLGWSKHYEFNESDLRCACDTIDIWIDSVAMVSRLLILCSTLTAASVFIVVKHSLTLQEDRQSINLGCFFPCGETQTMSHIVESCPLTKLNGGLSRLHSADEDAVSWLTNYGK